MIAGLYIRQNNCINVTSKIKYLLFLFVIEKYNTNENQANLTLFILYISFINIFKRCCLKDRLNGSEITSVILKKYIRLETRTLLEERCFLKIEYWFLLKRGKLS